MTQIYYSHCYISNKEEVINWLIRCEIIFTRLYRKRAHVTPPAGQLTTDHHTDAPWSALEPVTQGASLLWSCHQQPLEWSCRPLTGARPQGPCEATESPLKVQHVLGLDSFYLLLSHLQTQAVPLKKGRWKMPGRNAGFMACRTSRRKMVLGVSRHLTWWPQLTPRCLGDAFLEAASAQDFIAGEPHRPTYSPG